MKQRSISCRARQAGVTMVVSLIVLASTLITVASIGRSLHSSQLVAGNLAFRNASVQSSDAASAAAVQWLATTTDPLDNDRSSAGFYAAAVDPGWDSETYWARCQTCRLPADASGNVASWVVHRMCSAAGNEDSVAVQCARGGTGGAMLSWGAGGNSIAVDQYSYDIPAQLMYRVTARVRGPRNTLVFTQSMIAR